MLIIIIIVSLIAIAMSIYFIRNHYKNKYIVVWHEAPINYTLKVGDKVVEFYGVEIRREETINYISDTYSYAEKSKFPLIFDNNFKNIWQDDDLSDIYTYRVYFK